MLWLLRTWMSLREPPLFSPQTWCLIWGWLTWTAWGASWWRTGAGQEWCPTLCCPAELRRPAAEGAASAWMRIFDDPIAHRDLIGQNWRRDFIFNFFWGTAFNLWHHQSKKHTEVCSVTETISMSSRGLPFVLKCCCHSCCCKPQCQNCVQVPHTHSPEPLRLKESWFFFFKCGFRRFYKVVKNTETLIVPQFIPVNINESIITVLENWVEIFIGSEESA